MIRLQTITAHIDQCREGITLNQRPQNFRAGFRKRVRAIHGRSPRYVYSFPRSIRKCGAGWVSNFASFIGFLLFLRGFAQHTDICHIHQIPFPIRLRAILQCLVHRIKTRFCRCFHAGYEHAHQNA